MKQAIAKGAVWMVLFKLAERSLGLISVVVLARLLVPADFGLVAMAMSIIAFIDVATTFSFDIALIQRANPERKDYNAAWTLNVLIGAGCALLIVALAVPAALFYKEPRLTAVMLALAVGWLLHGFENIGVANFRREMNFRKEFRFLLSKKIVGFTVTLSLALTLQSYWALIAGSVASRFAGVVASYLMHPFRPRFSLVGSKQLVSFSSWLLMNNILLGTLHSIPSFFIGRVNGPRPLGLYTVGHEIAFLPSTELIAPINRAVLPGYSRMASQLPTLREGFVDVISVILIIALPASLGLAAIADPVVRVVLGDKWLDAIPVIQILAFSGAIGAMQSNNASAYIALGKQRILMFVLLTQLLVMIPSTLLLGYAFGILGVAYADLIASAIGLTVAYPILFKTLGLSASNYFRVIWRPFFAAGTMGLSIYMLAVELAKHGTSMAPGWQLAVLIPAGVAIYVSALGLLWFAVGKPQGAETIVLARLTEVTSRFRHVP